MSSSDLIRWGGLAGMLAGVAFIVLMMIPEPPPGSFFYVLGSLVFIAALLLLLVGLAGFHALQKGNYGRIGRAGFYTIIVGASAQLVAQVGLALGSTALEFLDFVGLLVVVVGFVLYGAATLQARVLPRWCGVGFIVGLPVWLVVSIVVGDEYGGGIGGDTVRAPVAGAGIHALVAERHSRPAARARELGRLAAAQAGTFGSGRVFPRFCPESFWFRRPSFGSQRLFGARPIVRLRDPKRERTRSWPNRRPRSLW